MSIKPSDPKKQSRGGNTAWRGPTLCAKGHDLTLPNAVYTIPSTGRRLCRQCKIATARSRYAVKQAAHLKRATQNPVAIEPRPDYPPSRMKSWPLTSCNELPQGLTPYMARNP